VSLATADDQAVEFAFAAEVRIEAAACQLSLAHDLIDGSIGEALCCK
jgi:hypothetical protein